ncbi:class I SAM-dependent methyltransferase [Sinimarinibacterium thermocellulolyticum]|uniref:Methyltransferase domain-containing protein n=1 Tax=Sinimarinibacterium thermocellulolyticum TaxID=3170016 RepID=A0ABV2A9J9_9GAMM
MPAAFATPPEFHYATSQVGWSTYAPSLRALIREHRLRKLIEIGGGANPSFGSDEVRALDLDYTLLDISQAELDKAPPGYRTLCADIASPTLQIDADYDFAFSHMLAEHVRDAECFHRNVWRLLRPGGYALHFFPTLWAPPFVVNWMLPERLADGLLRRLAPGRDRYRQAKFPAYYHWCRGPTRSQIARFERIGFTVERYDGYFGHERYYQRFPLVRRLHRAGSKLLSRHPLPSLTSFALVVLRKI